jgi:hypothetical protein
MRDHDKTPMDDFEIADPVTAYDETSSEAQEGRNTDGSVAEELPNDSGPDTEEYDEPFTSAS